MSEHFTYPRSSYYITENILDWDGQLAIVKLSPPMVFVRFDAQDSYMIDFDYWIDSIIKVDWIGLDKPSDEVQEAIFTDCWNFLSMHEAEEENRSEHYDDF